MPRVNPIQLLPQCSLLSNDPNVSHEMVISSRNFLVSHLNLTVLVLKCCFDVHVVVGFRGYCPHAKPLLLAGQPQECGVETACPNNYVCHINTAISRSVCCFDPGENIPRDARRA